LVATKELVPGGERFFCALKKREAFRGRKKKPLTRGATTEGRYQGGTRVLWGRPGGGGLYVRMGKKKESGGRDRIDDRALGRGGGNIPWGSVFVQNSTGPLLKRKKKGTGKGIVGKGDRGGGEVALFHS